MNIVPKVLKKADEQIGNTNILRDKKRSAMKPGKRLSKNRKVYYEKRKNRSDLARRI